MKNTLLYLSLINFYKKSLNIRFVHWVEKSRNRTIAAGKTSEQKFGDRNNNETDKRFYDSWSTPFPASLLHPPSNLWICFVYDRSNVLELPPAQVVSERPY